MKKILTLFMFICLLTGALCITSVSASAEEPTTEKVVIRVAGMNKKGDLILPESFTSFEDGWNKAAKLAEDHDWMDKNGIIRIVVDLYSDWKADTSGSFGSSWGDGFANSTIEVPSNTKMMINMNGYTIDRGKTSNESDGEVIYMGTRADLIINGGQFGDTIVGLDEDPGFIKMGKITGGYSCSGAGGIHVSSHGMLVLNNVHVDGNAVEDDDGAAIAAYNNSTVIMNGGSISDNLLETSAWLVYGECYGTLYLSDSTAILTDVEMANNGYKGKLALGKGVIFADDSTVQLENCRITNNSRLVSGKNYNLPCATIATWGSSSVFEAKNCTFENNGEPTADYSKGDVTTVYTLFYQYGGVIKLDTCTIKNNQYKQMFYTKSGHVEATNCQFTDNRGIFFDGRSDEGTVFTNCTIKNNTYAGTDSLPFSFSHGSKKITFKDCDFGNHVVESNEYKEIINTEEVNGAIGSIFGEGSFPMLISLLALAIAVVSLVMNISAKKKREKSSIEADNEED